MYMEMVGMGEFVQKLPQRLLFTLQSNTGTELIIEEDRINNCKTAGRVLK